MTFIGHKAVFTTKTLIFTKMIEYIHLKMREINKKYRITLKTSYYFIELWLVFQ